MDPAALAVRGQAQVRQVREGQQQLGPLGPLVELRAPELVEHMPPSDRCPVAQI